jgi:hypothetical protein
MLYLMSTVFYDDRVFGMVVSGRGKIIILLRLLIKSATLLYRHRDPHEGRDP